MRVGLRSNRIRRAVVDATADGTVLVAPAAAGAAPPRDGQRVTNDATRARTLRLTCVAGLAGAPVVVVPCARDDGLPLGVAFMGAPGSDRDLIAVVASALGSGRTP